MYEKPEVNVEEIKTHCECISDDRGRSNQFFDDSAFGLGYRCWKCGLKRPERKR